METLVLVMGLLGCVADDGERRQIAEDAAVVAGLCDVDSCSDGWSDVYDLMAEHGITVGECEVMP
jgi:hypothetical protein